MGSADRYTTVAIFLHWLIAAIVLGQFAFGWWMQEIPKQPPGPRAEAFNLHKSIGLVVLALMFARIAWRLGHPPPVLPAMPPWQARLARVTHLLLYVALVALPVTGYLGSVYSGYPVKFFGMPLPAWGGKDAELKELMSAAHLWLGWALALAFVLHMAGVAKHTLVSRDGLLRRMIPTFAPPRS
jgi:cytochrome b561